MVSHTDKRHVAFVLPAAESDASGAAAKAEREQENTNIVVAC